MSRRCDLTGKGVQSGNNVSHAHNKTKRRFLPNLQKASLLSDTLNQSIRMRLSTSAIRSVEKKGGIDLYLLSMHDSSLSSEMLQLKKRIKKVTVGKM